jgi:hypothetical protein
MFPNFDILNVIYASSMIFIFFYIYSIPIRYYIILLGHLALVFLTNDVLFPIDYFSDQIRYIHTAHEIRHNLDFIHYYNYDQAGVGNLANASLFFSLFPIPYLNSVVSIAMINFMLYSFLFIFLYKKNILVSHSLWFYLLFPSFALYTALGLRDILILSFMIISIYMVYKERYFFSIIVSLPLIFIKEQNFAIFIVSLLLYFAIKDSDYKSLKFYIKIVILFILIIFLIDKYNGVELIDYYRRVMYESDGNDIQNYIHLQNTVDLIITSLKGFFYFILKPLPWEVKSAIQLVQSFENIVIFSIMYNIVKKQMIYKDKFIKFLIIYLFISMTIYGTIVFNFGTSARYRFTFELIFIIFSLSIFDKNKNPHSFMNS